ncbi:hypothetical protein EXN66_Car008897 [Channa argus]|uniref:Uncharacterized protein n=1 Tax=Channa argus TaxID=215402 RepID=A0A6G1PSA0_CHAAH|nr:hypothetical protein EXN66_Car008897 [Channa argus]
MRSGYISADTDVIEAVIQFCNKASNGFCCCFESSPLRKVMDDYLNRFAEDRKTVKATAFVSVDCGRQLEHLTVNLVQVHIKVVLAPISTELEIHRGQLNSEISPFSMQWSVRTPAAVGYHGLIKAPGSVKIHRDFSGKGRVHPCNSGQSEAAPFTWISASLRQERKRQGRRTRVECRRKIVKEREEYDCQAALDLHPLQPLCERLQSQALVFGYDNSLNSPQTVPFLDLLAQPPPCRRPVRRYITPTAERRIYICRDKLQAGGKCAQTSEEQA